ncbi:MAG: hypothetical protein D6775_13510 [Caldilineae bacterium]|nr:MAG: hypothetical protein D6775_13510 [Caldilineae bacterium]
MGWQPEDIGAGIRFRPDPGSPLGVTAHFQAVPVTADPAEFISSVISTTFTVVQANEAESFQLFGDEALPDGHRQVEFIGRLDPDQPLAHVLAELWVESGVMVGLSLAAPVDNWLETLALWPLLMQGYETHDLAAARAALGLEYNHPSGSFGLTVPVTWGIVEEEENSVLFSDVSGEAQFQVSAAELNHLVTAQDLTEALNMAVGNPQALAGYQELERDTGSESEQRLVFENASDQGFYRTELRALAQGFTLFMTSFSAPPHDWELFRPAYDRFVSSLQLHGYAPLDEAAQDADPLLGIELGTPLWYVGRDGAVWVSAPIFNKRTRHLRDLTLAVNAYDEQHRLLGAESWRMQQKVLPSGGVGYMTLRLDKNVAAADKVKYVSVSAVDARDTRKPPPPAWGYEGGTATVNAKGDLVIEATVRNTGSGIRRAVYAVALLYNDAGDLVFARGQTQRLRRVVRPGKSINITLTVKGPMTDIASFDVVGEVPR